MIMDVMPCDEMIIRRFSVLIQKNRLAHAYLFVGAQGGGKTETALGIAKFINCENKSKEVFFCNRCSACLKIIKGNHPDIHIIEADETDLIKIEQIREMLTRIKLRPFQSLRKIFIIRDIEKLTLSSSHALLKTLEEPTQNSLLLLTTSVPEKILDTIRSRCHMMYFRALSREMLAEQLMKDKIQNQQEAHFLAYFTEGCFGKAQQLMKGKMLGQRKNSIEKFILARDSSDFIKKLIADKNKMKMKWFLDVLLSWMRDSVLIKVNVENQQLINLDYINDLKAFSHRFSFEALNDIYEEVVQTCRLFTENLNVKIPVMIIKERLSYE